VVNVPSAPSETDVFVIGGGPAGLAAALAARQKGFEVVVADRSRPPIDKACGEGLLPDGVAALRRLGVELGHVGTPFRGIRFLDNELEVEAPFAGNVSCGLGVRRALLHQVLMEHAEEAGIIACWQSRIEGISSSGVWIDGRIVRCRWIIGADGFHSRVRQWAGLRQVWKSARRIGLRQHFRIRPWTDFVEVYWHDHYQAYVTPIGPDEVCVAMIASAKEFGASDLPTLFPVLANRLGRGKAIGPPRGAISMSVKLSGVTCGRVALVGDASGSVDAVTGEGLALAFRQAEFLATALAAGDVSSYDQAHFQMGRMPRLMARLLLLMDGGNGLRRHALRALAAHPRIFYHLLSVHIGARGMFEFSSRMDHCDLHPALPVRPTGRSTQGRGEQ
jgi:flavin-dependent dehydrogenase